MYAGFLDLSVVILQCELHKQYVSYIHDKNIVANWKSEEV